MSPLHIAMKYLKEWQNEGEKKNENDILNSNSTLKLRVLYHIIAVQ